MGVSSHRKDLLPADIVYEFLSTGAENVVQLASVALNQRGFFEVGYNSMPELCQASLELMTGWVTCIIPMMADVDGIQEVERVSLIGWRKRQLT